MASTAQLEALWLIEMRLKPDQLIQDLGAEPGYGAMAVVLDGEDAGEDPGFHTGPAIPLGDDKSKIHRKFRRAVPRASHSENLIKDDDRARVMRCAAVSLCRCAGR